MRDFRWVSGHVAEVQRFINVPRRWCEQYPAHERRELWITADQGPDFKFVVHTTLMPARRGHRVLALLLDHELVALHNLQTGESVNYLRSDPPLLWRRCEVVIAAGCGGGHRGVRGRRRRRTAGSGRSHLRRRASRAAHPRNSPHAPPTCDRSRAARSHPTGQGSDRSSAWIASSEVVPGASRTPSTA